MPLQPKLRIFDGSYFSIILYTSGSQCGSGGGCMYVFLGEWGGVGAGYVVDFW